MIQLVLVYIDTNIIVDQVERRKSATTDFFARLKGDRDLEAITSIFALVEAVDAEGQIRHIANMVIDRMTWDEIGRKREKELTQDEREKAIQKVESFFKENDKVKVYKLKDEGWDTVTEVMKDLNISAPDAIHVATALTKGCAILLSNDSNLLKAVSQNPSYAIRLRGAQPEKIKDVIEETRKELKTKALDHVLSPTEAEIRALERLSDTLTVTGDLTSASARQIGEKIGALLIAYNRRLKKDGKTQDKQ